MFDFKPIKELQKESCCATTSDSCSTENMGSGDADATKFNNLSVRSIALASPRIIQM